jgi:fibronectin-binding autotransporter adhesin
MKNSIAESALSTTTHRVRSLGVRIWRALTCRFEPARVCETGIFGLVPMTANQNLFCVDWLSSRVRATGGSAHAKQHASTINNENNSMKRLLIKTGAALLCAVINLFNAGSAQAGTHTWSGGSAFGNVTDVANWSAGGAPLLSETSVTLIFPAAAPDKNVIINLDGLKITRLEIQGGGYSFSSAAGAKLHLHGGNDTVLSTGLNTFEIGLGVVLETNSEINVTADSLYIDGPISGTGGLTKSGAGELVLDGPAANTYSGTTTVEDGLLALSKSSGINAIGGPLVVGHPSASAFPIDVLEVRNPNQIPDNVAVTLHKTGRLNVQGVSESVASLDFTGGYLNTPNFGLLTLLGNVHSSAPELEFASISGNLALGAQSRLFTVDAGCRLDINAVMTGSVGFLKQGPGKLQVTGANTYTGATTIQAGEVALSGPDATLGTAAGGTVVNQGAQLLISWVDVGAEPLQLNGDPVGTTNSIFVAHGKSSWAGPVILNGTATNTIDVLNVEMAFSGVISGPGSLRLRGSLIYGSNTTMKLIGTAANTYTGKTIVDWGRLALGKTAGVNAIAGPLYVGHSSTNFSVYDRVELLANNQISDTSPVFTFSTGLLYAGDFSDSIASLDMTGGWVRSIAGMWTLLGNISVHGQWPVFSTIEGKLSLGSQTRLFNIDTNSYLQIGSVISGTGTAGITQQGGELVLYGANTYPGLTTIANGSCRLTGNGLPGSSAAGTVVSNGARLDLDGANIGNEPLQLNGLPPDTSGAPLSAEQASWSGPITLNGPGDNIVEVFDGSLTLSGAISGPGALRAVCLDGTQLILSGPAANTYSGGTEIWSGEVVLAKAAGVNAIPGALDIGTAFPSELILSNANQIADSAVVTIRQQGLLNLNSLAETIGAIEGNGSMSAGFGSLIAGGNNFSTTFGGFMGGIGFTPFTKVGSGTLLFTGTNTATARTVISGGKLIAHGLLSGPAYVSNSATLGGNGFVGNVFATNGIVSPGAGAGLLDTKNVILDSASSLRIELNGTNAGISYDQLNVTGTVTLASCTLNVTLGFASAGSDKFTIINNDGSDAVAGTFAGLAEGAQFSLSGQTFSITYQGGTGNDVVLTHINTPANVINATATSFANEGSNVHINGGITDPDGGDGFTLSINWGDGSPTQNVSFAAGTVLFHVEHTYTDDKAGAQASDSFTISYIISDNTGIGGFGQLSTTIGNVAPTVNAGADTSVLPSTPFTGSANFTDPGKDVWTASVNWGDGSAPETVPVNATNKSVSLNHLFASNGVYNVTLSVNDDDTGSGNDTLRVVVGPPGLTMTKMTNAMVQLKWPTQPAGFTLQTASSMPNTNWVAITNTPTVVSNDNVLTLACTNALRFFRLVLP